MSLGDTSTPAPLQGVWNVKSIQFNGKDIRIVTNDIYGPSTFIALCNILILRGDIEILPPFRKTVTYMLLSHLVAEYLLARNPGVDISGALSVLPYTLKGTELNPIFAALRAFHPASAHEGGGELKLFMHAGIFLVHGCIVDPNSAESSVLRQVQDYDTAVSLVKEADRLVDGSSEDSDDPFADPQEGPSGINTKTGSIRNENTPSSRSSWGEERQIIEDAMVVRRFLDQTQSQMTYHGLFQLAKMLPPDTPTALFRNSHLSVLYKTSSRLSTPPSNNDTSLIAGPSSSTIPPPDSDTDYGLYTLVTDSIFQDEPSVVWERLEDIDGNGTYVDHDFIRSCPAGGDIVGQTAEQVRRAVDDAAGVNEYGATYDVKDASLARQVQLREDRLSQKAQAGYDYLRKQEQIRIAEEEKELQSREAHDKILRQQIKRKGDCIIM